MCSTLVTEIGEDPFIKQRLYPMPGPNASTADGGGLEKTVAHGELAVILFTNHPVYGPEFAKAKGDTKKEAQWGIKVKNKLKAYVLTFVLSHTTAQV
jgi:hypothetical protein